MPRFLIQAPHDGSTKACARVVQVFLESGSHFLTHADWGCKDGDHNAWIVVETDSKDEARRIVPPQFRSTAKIVQLNCFTLQEVESILKAHEA